MHFGQLSDRWSRTAISALFLGSAFFVLATILTNVSALGDDEAPGLRAGAAKSNTTPPLGSSLNGGMSDRKATYVHDDLHARCLVLDDGQTQLAIVICDLCMIPREIVLDAKAQIREAVGIPPENVLISATHSHSCPTCAPVFQSDMVPGYPKFLARRIADGVQRAFNNLEPAEIGWGVGENDRQVFNRRWHLKPGTMPPGPFPDWQERDKVKMNPGVENPNLVKPAGPIDPEVPVVAVRSVDGRPIALLANYSLHYVGGTGGGHVSADYFGMFADRVQELLEADRIDPPFVGMMSNGTSGDINNVNFQKARPASKPYEQMKAVADELAEEAVKVAKSISYRTDVDLDAKANDLELGVRKPTSEEVEKARSVVEAARSENRELRGLEEIYSGETVDLADYPETVPVTLQTLRIGGLGIAAIPCEVFVEIGLELKEKSPFDTTFTIELANGYNGYLPTEAQHELGGYETWRAKSSYLEVTAARTITDTLLEMFEQLHKAASR